MDNQDCLPEICLHNHTEPKQEKQFKEYREAPKAHYVFFDLLVVNDISNLVTKSEERCSTSGRLLLVKKLCGLK